jgi:phosphatidylethanolamine-binding protein (PEBP) family uncharacterized protein
VAERSQGKVLAPFHTTQNTHFDLCSAAVEPYHHYTFELFALDTKLSLGPDASQANAMKAMDGHILMKGVLVGRFHRP